MLLLQFKTQELFTKPDGWQNLKSHKHEINVVKSIRVVNDIAERGVQLGYDFLTSAREEHNSQNILQIVENDCNCNPNQRHSKEPFKSCILSFHFDWLVCVT